MEGRYYSFDKFARQKFGEKVYKLALDGGMTCPNRDGTLGTQGCIFCANGSGDFAEKPAATVFEQIENAKRRVADKFGGRKYIAYFQSYTNTYAPEEYLERLFFGAAAHPAIAALSIATRPDCLPPDATALLSRLAAVKPVFVELGLQTSDSSSARLIGRGYDLPVYDDAVSRLKACGINTVTHIIFGLPGEDDDTMLGSVRHAIKAGTDGIKIQLLHVLKGTALAEMYDAGAFECLTLEHYVKLAGDAVNIIPPGIVIHRLTGDAPKKLLIEPQWSANKKAVLGAINASFKSRNVIQGSLSRRDSLYTDANLC